MSKILKAQIWKLLILGVSNFQNRVVRKSNSRKSIKLHDTKIAEPGVPRRPGKLWSEIQKAD